jgi:hypothetical protein
MPAKGVVFAFVLVIFGCTSIRVQPADSAATVKHVCIRDNPKVIVSDFVPVVRDGFARHGISTEVFSGDLHGSALVEGQQVAYAEYHLKGKGGYSLMKWQGTKTKMDPVTDQLLEAY